MIFESEAQVHQRAFDEAAGAREVSTLAADLGTQVVESCQVCCALEDPFRRLLDEIGLNPDLDLNLHRILSADIEGMRNFKAYL